jgi:GTPase SAR1 family protein
MAQRCSHTVQSEWGRHIDRQQIGPREQESVAQNEAENFGHLDQLDYCETSVLGRTNIQEVFQRIVQIVYRRSAANSKKTKTNDFGIDEKGNGADGYRC